MSSVKFDFKDLIDKFKDGDLKISEISVVKKICTYFNDLERDNGEIKFYQATLLVYKGYFHLKNDRSEMCKSLLDNKFLDGLCKLIESKQKSSLGSNFKNEDYLLLNMFYIILVNFTIDNKEFCQAVYKTMIDFILRNLENKNLLSNWNEFPEKRQIIYDSVSIIYHTLLFGQLRDIDKYKGKENVLILFLSDKEFVNEINCTGFDLMTGVSMCLINGGNYGNKGSLVIEIVKKFIENVEELGKGEYEYFSIFELRQSLSLMNTYKDLRKIIDNHNMNKYLVDVSISVGENSLNDGWDIFLSYCHANDTVVDGIYQCLVNQGIRVWRDKEEMAKKAQTRQAMTEGIKKSKLFLAALSKSYEKSENCMKEFHFAIVTSNKPYIIVKVEENYNINDDIKFDIRDVLYVKYRPSDREGFYRNILDKVNNM